MLRQERYGLVLVRFKKFKLQCCVHIDTFYTSTLQEYRIIKEIRGNKEVFHKSLQIHFSTGIESFQFFFIRYKELFNINKTISDQSFFLYKTLLSIYVDIKLSITHIFTVSTISNVLKLLKPPISIHRPCNSLCLTRHHPVFLHKNSRHLK